MVELFSSDVETSLNALLEEGTLYFIVENEGKQETHTSYDEAFKEYVTVTQEKQQG